MRRIAAAILLISCGPVVGTADTETTGVVDDSSGEATTVSVTTSPGTSGPSTASTSVGETTTAAGTSTETGDSDDGAEHSFILEDIPGGGSVECDIWDQDCPKGEKCMPWANDGGDAWNASRCSVIPPDAGSAGEPCVAVDNPYSGIDDCGPASMCWDVDPDTLEGVCVGFCGGTEHDPECAEGLGCFIEFEGVILACLPECDPLNPMCSEGEMCTSGRWRGWGPNARPFICLPTPQFSPQPYGATCEYFSQCDVGLACVDAMHVPGCESYDCCTTIGDLTQMPVCPDPTQTCIPFDDTMPDTGLCYCGVPQ